MSHTRCANRMVSTRRDGEVTKPALPISVSESPNSWWDYRAFFHSLLAAFIQLDEEVTKIPKERMKISYLTAQLVIWAGVLYCMFMTLLIAYLVLYVSCPVVENEETCSDLTWLAVLFLVEVLANLACFQYYRRENDVHHWQRSSVVADLVRSHVDEEAANTPTMDGKYCVECNRTAPIRSHHCPLCSMCVLRKDHHCFVTGGCVGLGNQRYFMVFLLWACTGCFIGMTYMFRYMNMVIKPWYPFGFLHYIGPVAIGKWFFGYETLGNAFFTLIFSFAVASGFCAFSFLAAQIFYTCHGYTMYEYHSLSIREEYEGDGETVMERFRLVFGPYFLLNIIMPMPWLQQRLTPEIADNLFRVRSKIL